MDKKSLQKIGKSLFNVFVGAAVALYSAGETDPMMLLNAGLGAVLVTLGRYFNPKDESFGIVKKK